MRLSGRRLRRTLPANWFGSGLGRDLGQNTGSQIRGWSEIASNRPSRRWKAVRVRKPEDRRQQANDRGQLCDFTPERRVAAETLHRPTPFVLGQRAKHQSRRIVQRPLNLVG